jgi:hypothetical protein
LPVFVSVSVSVNCLFLAVGNAEPMNLLNKEGNPDSGFVLNLLIKEGNTKIRRFSLFAL